MTVPVLHIVDLSDNNPAPYDFVAMKAAGVDGVILKLSESTTYRNELFDAAWPAIKAAGLWRALYHFARPETNSATAEAAWMLSQAPALETYDGVFLDIETGTGELSPWVLAWWAIVGPKLGVPANVYSYPDFIKQHLTDPALGRMNLWLASLGGLPPAIGPWSSVALWQYTWTSQVPGTTGNVDESQIARDLAGLRQLGKPPVTVTVIQAGALKQQPNHTCQPAIDPNHQPVYLAVGQVVLPCPDPRTGMQISPDGLWAHLSLLNSPVHGYFLRDHLSTA